MLEWKNRQATFHRMHSPDDLLINKTIVVRENVDDVSLVDDVVDYFTKPIDVLIYPAKSYAVALIYSQLLCDNFGEDFHTVLNDENLLYGNDPYFVPYSKAKDIYDSVIANIDLRFKAPPPQVETTMEYFNQEFYISIV